MNPARSYGFPEEILASHLTPLQRDVITLAAEPQLCNWPDRWQALSDRQNAIAQGLVRRKLLRAVDQTICMYEATSLGLDVAMLIEPSLRGEWQNARLQGNLLHETQPIEQSNVIGTIFDVDLQKVRVIKEMLQHDDILDDLLLALFMHDNPLSDDYV